MLSAGDDLGGSRNSLTNGDGIRGWDNSDVDLEREAKGFSGRQPEELDDNLRPVPQAIRQLLRIPQFQADRMELLAQRGQSFDHTSAPNRQRDANDQPVDMKGSLGATELLDSRFQVCGGKPLVSLALERYACAVWSQGNDVEAQLRLSAIPVQLGVAQTLNVPHHTPLQALEILPGKGAERKKIKLPDDGSRCPG